MDENNQNPMEPMQPMEPVQPVQDNTQGQYQQYQAPQPEQTQYQQYQVPQQNYQPQYQQTQPQGGSGFGVAALVLGIIALLLCWIPYINIVCTILAFIFGIIGIVKKSGKGQAIAGLVLSILAAIPTIVVMMLLNVIYGALGWFGATLTNTTTRNSSVWNSLGTIWNSVENELGNAGNELSNLGNRIGNELNTVSNALSNITSNNTTETNTTTPSTSTVDSKSSTVASPAKIGEWTTAASYKDGNYVDTPVRIDKVTRGADAEEIIKKAGQKVSTLKEGVEYLVIDYSVDTADLKSYSWGKSLSGLYFYVKGNDGNILKYDNKTWSFIGGGNLESTSSIKTDIYSGKYMLQVPKGCTDYLIQAKASDGTIAYIKGE